MKQLLNKIQNSKQDIEKYIKILSIWQPHLNLISQKTVSDIWNRHVLDSAQLFYLLPKNISILVDVGSGGGFPGIVLGILNKNMGYPIKKIILVESDTKKTIFLKEVNRSLKLNLEVINKRIENLPSMKVDVITARAFAELSDILTLCRPIVSRETILLLPKGKEVDQEIKNNKISCKISKLKSLIQSDSCILKVEEVQYEN